MHRTCTPHHITQGLTFAAGWGAACALCRALSPPGLAAALQGFASAVWFGLGAGVGGLVLGSLLEVGARLESLDAVGRPLLPCVILHKCASWSIDLILP